MKSKQLILTAFFVALCLQLFAQRPRFHPQVHEIGAQVFSTHFLSLTRPYLESPDWRSVSDPLNGIRYKYHLDKKNALRGGVLYRKLSFQDPVGEDVFTADWRGLDVTLGVERKLNIKRFQLFAALDGLIAYGQSNKIAFDVPNNPQELNTNMFGYGLGGAVGLRYFFNPYASITIENGAQMLLYNKAYTPIGESSPPSLGINREREFNMLSVYFSLHFGKMKKKCECWHPKRR